MSKHRTVPIAILALLLVGPDVSALAQSCSRQPTGLVPLTELTEGTYLDQTGGLYPDGGNTVPTDHLSIGLDLASGIEPLDESGSADPAGTIGLISIGVSNTRDNFAAFIEQAAAESGINPSLAIVNGAQGARDLNSWANGSRSNPWRRLERIVLEAGVAPPQVQVAWVMAPDRSRGTISLDDIPGQVDRMTDVMQHLRTNYPNIRVAYLSSRIYGGHSPRGEPRAYQHGFTVRSFIAQQIAGDEALNPDPARGQVMAPWVAWGPYTWADGSVPREDGLTWECEDFERDGIHPSPSGAEKVGALLMDHFRSHPTASTWFLASGSDATTTTPTVTATTTPTTIDTSRSTTASSSTTVPPPTSTLTAATSAPPPTDSPVDVPWLLGGVALGLVLSLGTAWSLRERNVADAPPGEDG